MKFLLALFVGALLTFAQLEAAHVMTCEIPDQGVCNFLQGHMGYWKKKLDEYKDKIDHFLESPGQGYKLVVQSFWNENVQPGIVADYHIVSQAEEMLKELCGGAAQSLLQESSFEGLHDEESDENEEDFQENTEEEEDEEEDEEEELDSITSSTGLRSSKTTLLQMHAEIEESLSNMEASMMEMDESSLGKASFLELEGMRSSDKLFERFRKYWTGVRRKHFNEESRDIPQWHKKWLRNWLPSQSIHSRYSWGFYQVLKKGMHKTKFYKGDPDCSSEALGGWKESFGDVVKGELQARKASVTGDIAHLSVFGKIINEAPMCEEDADLCDDILEKVDAATADLHKTAADADDMLSNFQNEEEQYETRLTKCEEDRQRALSMYCAFSKLRGELFMLSKTWHTKSVQDSVDCEVSEWYSENGCSKQCGGGEMIEKRYVMTESQGKFGVECPVLERKAECNVQPCAIDCKQQDWTNWSPCSKACSGGHKARFRETHQYSLYGGYQCGESIELQACNMQPCPVDCVLGEWSQWSECNKACGGGEQTRKRQIVTPDEGGGKPCSHLHETRSCNTQSCAIDCKVSSWGPWSDCSKSCGGGTSGRSRTIKREPAHGGKECPSTLTEEKACNTEACPDEKEDNSPTDCVLSDWNAWTDCSKSCGGGTSTRSREITIKSANGGQECPSTLTETKICNTQACPIEETATHLPICENKMDIVLLLDMSGSLRKRGFDAVKLFAKHFVEKIQNPDVTNVAIIPFSGPRTWSLVQKCLDSSPKTADFIKNKCKINTLSHLSSDKKHLLGLLEALDWSKGSTLTSMALARAIEESTLGRADAKTVVVVVTDGRPLSGRNTQIASHKVRENARLMWVPVTRFAPLRFIRSRLATRRWQDNVFPVRNFADLRKGDLIQQIGAELCQAEQK